MKKLLLVFFFISSSFLGFSQTTPSAFVCPHYAGNVDSVTSPNVILPCGQNCTSLSAVYQAAYQTNTYTVNQITYAPPATYNSGTATGINQIDDEWSASPFTLPFNFCFFGNNYNQLVIGSNGVITFDVTQAGGYCPWPLTSGATIPTTTYPMNSIMFPYEDLDGNPASQGGGELYVQTIGTAPCRAYVISIYQTTMFDCWTTAGLIQTSQLVLYENTNIIDIYIQNKGICSGWNDGNAIEGIQNSTGTVGYAVPGRNNVQWSASNDAWRFQPSGPVTSSLQWLQNGTVIGTGDTIQVCPPSNSSTNYVAAISYSLCGGTTATIYDTVNVRVVQSAGPPQYVSCPTLIDSAVMDASGSGTWTTAPGNPGTSTVITHPTSPTTSITGFTADGTYRFIWSNGGCVDTGIVIVSSRPSAGSDTSTCIGGTATMSAVGTGTWVAIGGNPAPTLITNPTSPTTTITGFTVGGDYYYKWYVGSCSDTAVVHVPIFTISASVGDTVLCKYQTTILTGTANPPSLGPFTFIWSDPTTVVSPTSPTTATQPLLTSTTYTLLVISAGGCQLSQSVSVALRGSAPQVRVTPSDNNVCPGDTVTLNSVVLAESLVPCGLTDSLFSNNNTYTGYINNDVSSTTGSPFGFTAVEGSPFRGGYNAFKIQYLLRKDELNALGLSSGTITDIAFYVQTLNSTAPYDTFTVSMGCTNVDSLTGFVSNLQEVIPPLIGSGIAPTANSSLFANSWNPLPFTNYFNWDGASNIVVQICYTIPSNSFSQDDFVSYNQTSYMGSAYEAYNFSGNGCDLDNGNTPAFAQALNTRANILFHESVPNVLTYTWSPTPLTGQGTPSASVIVSTDTTYTLVVNDNGCSNDSLAHILINRNLAITATPDTTLCNGIDTVQLNVNLTNPPASSCVQGYTVSSIPYSAISGNITTIPPAAYLDANGTTFSTDDGAAGPYSIGFTFPFYCDTFSQFYVNSNGWITFQNPYPATTVPQEYLAQTFPPSASDLNPQKVIELMMGNYNLASCAFCGGGGGSIDYFISGSAPNRTLVVQFNSMQDVTGAYTTSGEMHLYETTGIIDILLTSSNYAGTNHTTGVKDSTGLGTAAPGRNNQQYTISQHEAWRFTPQYGSSVAVNSSVWSPNTFLSNDSLTNPYAYPPSTQTYYVNTSLVINQFTHPTTCVVRDSVTIVHSSFPHSISATPPTICPGDTSQLAFSTTATVSSYAWTPAFGLSSTSIANPLASVLDTATFYIHAVNTAGCSVNDTITVNTYPIQHPVIGPGATICYSDSLPLSLYGNYSNFQWYSVDTSTGARTLVSSGATDSVFYAHPSGAYVLEVTPASGQCSYYSNVVNVDSFTRQPIVVDTSGPTGFCVGGNVVLQVNQGLTNVRWTPASYGSQASFPVTSTGVFSYTADDIHGCLVYSDTVHVNVNPVPTFVYNNYRNPICSADKDTIVATTNPAGSAIVWTYNATQTSGDTIISTGTGIYYVQANLQGCINVDSILITGAPSPSVSLPASLTICSCSPNSVVTASPSGGTPGYSYSWSNGGTGATTIDSLSGQTQYVVTVTDANNCTAVSNAEVITMSCPLATISVNPPSDTVFVHDTATLIATAVGGSSYSYQWYSDSAQIILPNTLDSVHAVINTPRMDSIYLVITDLSTQCTDTVVQVVHAIDFAGFVMGDAFTPNGDGVNDYFYPVLSDSTNSTAKVEAFRIYNRWGQMVYNSTVRPGWDGNFANQSQPAGAYLYFVTISYPDPNNPSRLITKSLEGTVMLLR